MRYKRVPALVFLLLATVLSCFAASRSSAAGQEASGPHQTTQTLEDGSIYYEETPPVQIISLEGLEPVDTRAAANPPRGSEVSFVSVDPAEMGTILAECTLEDNTIIRLYATAGGLIDGAFLRPGGAWTRFVQLYTGTEQVPNYAKNATLTAYSAVLGHDGFLLRTCGNDTGMYSYHYYWFDGAGELQVLTASSDPVSLDLDGDGAAELAYEIAEQQSSMSFYCQREDGTICRVTPSAYISGQSQSLVAVEAEGPGPVRLIYRYQDGHEEKFCAVTFRDGALELEMDIVYVPASLENAVLPTAPALEWTAQLHVSVTSPDGWVMDGAGEAASLDLWSILWESPYANAGDAVIVPTDAPLDEETAYTVAFSSSERDASFSWTLDAEGVCRFDDLAGNYRLVRTGGGSLPAYCHDLLRIYCDASRTSRGYDSQGHWLARNLSLNGMSAF